MPAIWNPSTARYTNSRGKVVSDAQLRGYVEAANEAGQATLRSLTKDFLDNKITLQDWTTGCEPVITQMHSAAGQLAAGGRAQLTPSLRGQLGAAIKFQKDRFRQFWLQVEDGKLSAAQITDRIEQYGTAPIGTFEQIQLSTKKTAGFKYAQNILNDGANHCDECPAITAKGKIPIAKYVPTGRRKCLARCRCSTVYS